MTTSLPWWRTDTYDWDYPVPASIQDLAGPKGLALVKAWPDGRTDQGWGLQGPKHDPTNGFMPRYMRGEFNDRRVLYGYNRGKWNFALIMRSVRVVCIDIDGKNGGLEHAKRLGMLPYTLAETSKSGDGYHLFYEVDEEWDDLKGFGLLGDRIGVEQGVDIRATGCVYHYPSQRWNDDRPIAPLPDHLRELIVHREQKLAATTARIDTILANNDDMEVLMMQDEILVDLAKPIPAGKRNVTLFAIGNQMRQATIPDWQDKLTERGIEVGLDSTEIEKIVENVERYGDNA
jgi:hypothetical protein